MKNSIKKMKEQLQEMEYSLFYGYYNERRTYVTVFAAKELDKIIIIYQQNGSSENQITIPHSDIKGIGIDKRTGNLFSRSLGFVPGAYIRLELKSGKRISIFDRSNKTPKFGGDLDKIHKIISTGVNTSVVEKKETPKDNYVANNFSAERKDKTRHLLNEADNLFEKQLFEEAIKIYQQAAEFEPTNWLIYHQIAKTFVFASQFDETVRNLEKSLKLAPKEKHYNLRKEISELLFDAEAYKQAYFTFLPKTNEQDFTESLKYLTGYGEIEEAINILTDNIEKYPNSFKSIVDDISIPQENIDLLYQKESIIVKKLHSLFNETIDKVEKDLRYLKYNSDSDYDALLPEAWKKHLERFQKARTVHRVNYLQNILSEITEKIVQRKRTVNLESILNEKRLLTEKYGEKTIKEIHKFAEKLNPILSLEDDKEKSEEIRLFINDEKKYTIDITSNELKIAEKAFEKTEKLHKKAKNLYTNLKEKLDTDLDNLFKKNKLRQAKEINQKLLLSEPKDKKYITLNKTIQQKQNKKRVIINSSIGAVAALVAAIIIIVPIIREKQLWNKSKENNSYKSYYNYLSVYPDNSHALEAKTLGKEALMKEAKLDSTVELINNNGGKSYLSEVVKNLKTRVDNVSYDFIDLDNNQVFELVIKYLTRGSNSCPILKIYAYNFDKNKFETQHIVKCLHLNNDKILKYSLNENFNNFYSKSDFEKQLPEKNIDTVRFFYQNKTIYHFPKDENLNNKIIENIKFLAQQKIPQFGDNGLRKAFAVNIAAYHFNNRNILETKQLFFENYQLENDKQQIWDEIMKRINVVSFVKEKAIRFSGSNEPKETVKLFIEKLGERDYYTAFAQTKNPNWSNFAWFRSVKGFGGITKTKTEELILEYNEDGSACVFIDYYSYDPANRDGRYKQNFFLEKIDNKWKIIKVELTE